MCNILRFCSAIILFQTLSFPGSSFKIQSDTSIFCIDDRSIGSQLIRSIDRLPSFFFFFNVNFNTVTNRKTIKTIYFYFSLSSSLPFSYPFFFLSFRIVEIFKKKKKSVHDFVKNESSPLRLFIYLFFFPRRTHVNFAKLINFDFNYRYIYSRNIRIKDRTWIWFASVPELLKNLYFYIYIYVKKLRDTRKNVNFTGWLRKFC